MLGAATLAGLPSDVPRNRVADKGRDEVRLSGCNPPGDESAHERELRPEDPGRPPGDECAGGGTGPAYVMRAQRDRIPPGSRHASPARQNPPRRDSREPTSHNSSSGDMTNSTPPGAPSGGARTPGAAGAGGGGPDGVGGGLAPSPGVPGRLVPSGSRSPGPAPGGAVGREPRGNRGITAERPVGGGMGAPRMAIAAPPSFQGTRPRFRNRSSCAAVV